MLIARKHKLALKRAGGELRDNLKTGRRIVVTVFAGALVLIGFVGQFIPIFPGKAVMFAGLVMLSMYSPTVHAWVKRRSGKYPRIESFADRFRNTVIGLLHRRGGK